MAPKRTAKSSASSKGATKSTPSTGTRKSSRTTRATSSEPRQLRSTSTDAPDLFGSQDPEEILKKARKQKQSSRASSRALSEDPGPNDERPDEPVNESANKSSKPESPSPSAEQAETSSGRADEQPTNVANQSSRQSSVESIAPTVEESTLQTFHQHNLSVVIEDPTEESVLSQHASSTKYKRQTHAQQTSSTQYTSNTHYTQEVQSIDYGTGTFSETAREPSFSSESERGSPSPLLEPTQPSFPVEETIDIATQPQTITQQTEVIELSSGSEGEDNDFEGDYQHGYQESQYYQDPCRVESIIDEDSEGQYEDEGRNDVDSEDDLEDDHERDHDEDDDDMEDLLAGSLQEANTLTPRVALNGQYFDFLSSSLSGKGETVHESLEIPPCDGSDQPEYNHAWSAQEGDGSFTVIIGKEWRTLEVEWKREDLQASPSQDTMGPPLTSDIRPSRTHFKAPSLCQSRAMRTPASNGGVSNDISHLVHSSLKCDYHDTPQAEKDTPTHIDHLFNSSLMSVRQASSAASFVDLSSDDDESVPDKESHASQSQDVELINLDSDDDFLTPYSKHQMVDTAIADDDAALVQSSPFNPTCTSTPYQVGKARKLSKSLQTRTDAPTHVNAPEFPPSPSLRPYQVSHAHATSSIHATQPIGEEFAVSRSTEKTISEAQLHDVLEAYRKALIPDANLDGETFEEYKRRTETELGIRGKQINDLKEQNSKIKNTRELTPYTKEQIAKFNKRIEDLENHCDEVEQQDKQRIRDLEDHIGHIQNQQGLIQEQKSRLTEQLQKATKEIEELKEKNGTLQQLVAVSLKSNHVNDMLSTNNLLTKSVAKSPVLTENESAEAMTNEHSQPHPAPHTEDVETTSSSAQIATNDKPKDDTPSKNTTKESAKDGTTPMDTDAPGTPKVPASASVLSRMYQTFVSPIKFFTGGSGKESTPLLSKKIPSTINKLDKKSPSKRLGHTPKFMPQTPTKSARAMASPEKAYFPHSEKSVKFTPPRAISEAPSASSNTPNDSSRAWTQYYLHHGVRKRHIRKWNEFQLWQQTRSDVETLADAQRITDMMYERSLFEQAEQRRVSKLNCQAGLSSVTSSKKRTADAFSTAEDSPAKKQRLAFSSKQTVAPPGSKAPVPGQVGYHSSTELPPAGASSIWVPDSVRASPARGNEESPTTSHLFGSTTVPGASLGHNATSNTDVGSERSSPGRTFGCDFDDDDMSMISQAASIGRTFKVPDDSDDETMDESMEDSAGEDWRDKPLSQWTKSNMDAYKKAPLSTGAEAPEPSLLAAVKSVLADSVPDAVGQAHNQLDFPRLTELGMSYRDFLTVYYPDNRGVITYTRSDYYHNLVKPPGTESMNADERARWKFQQEWKDWRKFGEAVRLYKEDDTPSLVAQIDGRRQEIKDKRKRADDEEQQLVLQSQELERRKQRLDLEEKELESRRTSLEQQKKAVDSIPPPPPKQNIFTAPSKSSVFNSLMSDLENQSQKAQPGSSFQDAASRVTVPSTNNSRSATSQAPLSSTISPQNPPPFIYDGQGNVVASTPSAPTASTSTWTQPPPPAPSPAHAQLPQTKTVQVPAAPANKYAPKRPSRLREMETHSSPMKSIEAHDEPDFMKAIPTMTSFEPMFANGRLPTPPEPDISEILQAMAKFAAQGNREPFYGGIAPPSS